MADITIKQGATFNPVLQLFENNETTPKSLVNTTVVSKIRDKSKDFIVTLTTTITDQAQGIITPTPVDTGSWPIGYLFWDVVFTKAGIDEYTETIKINVIRSES